MRVTFLLLDLICLPTICVCVCVHVHICKDVCVYIYIYVCVSVYKCVSYMCYVCLKLNMKSVKLAATSRNA